MPRDQDDDSFRYWTFADLLERRIVRSRPGMFRLQRNHGFPRPVILSSGERANALFPVTEVKSWLAEREQLGAANRAPIPRPGGRPRGRPRKVVTEAPPPKRPRGRPRKEAEQRPD